MQICLHMLQPDERILRKARASGCGDLFPDGEGREEVWRSLLEKGRIQRFESPANLAAWLLWASGSTLDESEVKALWRSLSRGLEERRIRVRMRGIQSILNPENPSDITADIISLCISALCAREDRNAEVLERLTLCVRGLFVVYSQWMRGGSRFSVGRNFLLFLQEHIPLPDEEVLSLFLNIYLHGLQIGLDIDKVVCLSLAFEAWSALDEGEFQEPWFDLLDYLHRGRTYVDWRWFEALATRLGETHRVRLFEATRISNLNWRKDLDVRCWKSLHACEQYASNTEFYPTHIKHTKSKGSTFVRYLERLVNARDETLRWAPVYMLRELRQGRILGRWFARLLRVLVRPGKGQGTDMLMRLLWQKDSLSTFEVVRGLGYLEVEDTHPLLMNALSNFDPEKHPISRKEAARRVVEIVRVHTARDPSRGPEMFARFEPLVCKIKPLLKELEAICATQGSPWFEAEEVALRTALKAPLLRPKDDKHVWADQNASQVLRAVGTVPCVEAREHILLHSAYPFWSSLYTHAVNEDPSAYRAVHSYALHHASKPIRDVAVQTLGSLAQRDLALELAYDMLQDRRAFLRTCAARIFVLLQAPEASDTLLQARSHEKAASVRKALDLAVKACDSRSLMTSPRWAWTPDDIPPVNTLLECLRNCVHEEPSPMQWAQLCDLTELLHRIGQSGLALDYLQHGTHPCTTQDHCIRPWGWGEGVRGPLAPLGHTGRQDTAYWVPAATLLDAEQLRDFVTSCARHLTPRGSRKKLHAERAIALMYEHLFRLWIFCQEHELTPNDLRLRLDGGMYANMSRAAQVTSLQLLHGFGLHLMRVTARRTQGGTSDTVLVYEDCKVPTGHPLRDHPTYSGAISRGRIDLGQVLK